MKIVFEYKDGTVVRLIGYKMTGINSTGPKYDMLDSYLSDPKVERIYIIADDNSILDTEYLSPCSCGNSHMGTEVKLTGFSRFDTLKAMYKLWKTRLYVRTK